MPKQREKMTEVHSCGSPPFSTCLGAVASFIISQGQKCHKKPFPLVYHQSHKEKSVKGGHRPQRLPLILFFVGYNAGGENGCPSVPLLPPVLHCPFRRKKVKGGLRPFFICCTFKTCSYNNRVFLEPKNGILIRFHKGLRIF